MRYRAKFHQVQMPSFYPDRAAIFFYFSLHRANSETETNDISLAESCFAHSLFSVMAYQGAALSNPCR